MAWNKFFSLLLGCSLVLAETVRTPNHPANLKVGADELLAYECAKSVASLVSPAEEIGPIFTDGRLVFTSIEANDASRLLLVNAGYGGFVINLESTGVNRLRFRIPTGANGASTTFFLSYLHGGASMHSRFFEYSENRPPVGQEEVEYALVEPKRAEYLLPHFDYAIHETAEATVSAITDGKFTRDQLSRHKLQSCEAVAEQAPNLASNLRHNVDMLDILVTGPATSDASSAGRMPASITSYERKR